jgi:hypothetical protein
MKQQVVNERMVDAKEIPVVWILVGEFLDTKSVINLGRVSKMMKQLFLSEEFWNSRFKGIYYPASKFLPKKKMQSICGSLDLYVTSLKKTHGRIIEFPPQTVTTYDARGISTYYHVSESKVYFCTNEGDFIVLYDLHSNKEERCKINDLGLKVDIAYSTSRWLFHPNS